MFYKNLKLPDPIRQYVQWFCHNYYLPKWLVFAIDNFLVIIVVFLAYILRFNFVFRDFNFDYALHHAILTFVVYCIFSLIFRPYSGLLRHTTIVDVFTVILTNSFSTLTLFILSLVGRRIGFNTSFIIPISVILIHYGTITVMLVLMRILIKLLYLIATSSLIEKKKVLIFGAGEMGVVVKRLIQSDIHSDYEIAGFLDDSKSLQGKKLNGFPVYNPKLLNSNFLLKNKIRTLIFAIKEISVTRKSEIIHFALNNGLEILQTPAVDKWLNGQLQMNQIQKVNLNDLLGRDPIQLNMEIIGKGLKGKTILVTGAAGSIGSEIVRQLSRFEVKKMILFDQAETPINNLSNELNDKFNLSSVKILLADITNFVKLESIFMEYHPDIVFHAAAYKHVPLMEENPHEAVRVNIAGTEYITQLSLKYGVRKFVMISTDKAVNPANVMGASKRVCEIIVQMKAQQSGNRTQFVITRFGNVLGSNGSVIPIFKKQIEEGGPVTVTHPEITRYFMTIPEACQLVLEAGFMGKGGEIFVFDMGEPVKISDLAHQMIRLSGLIPEKDIKIVYTGLRPGEKLYEELLTNKENTGATHHPKIKIAYVENYKSKQISTKINNLINNIYKLTKEEVILSLKQIVPEYNYTININGGVVNNINSVKTNTSVL